MKKIRKKKYEIEKEKKKKLANRLERGIVIVLFFY
jgi:hypothetical protein